VVSSIYSFTNPAETLDLSTGVTRDMHRQPSRVFLVVCQRMTVLTELDSEVRL
jgi:hypothetical protein